MNSISRFLLLAITVFGLVGCAAETTKASEPPADTTTGDAADSGAAAPADQVEYEPAFPTEVSAEPLRTEDVEQQQESHSHGGQSHAHSDEEDGNHGTDGH